MSRSGEWDRGIVCIRCGTRLAEWKCKLQCPRCGYFEDCSDGGTNLAHEVILKEAEGLGKG